nr:S-formylglutathione hydrolase [Iodidimonas gelatinilytica]
MMEIISENLCFGGVQRVYSHESRTCGGPMRLGVYLPPDCDHSTAPVLLWLSGLTCTEQNFITKAGAQRVAAELGMVLVAPDTSPRGDGTPDAPDEAYDLGLGAGFYVDATESPWAQRYRMYRYIADELPQILPETLGLNTKKMGISGHSMGGHGALIMHLKNPALFQTVSAFAPIVAPMQVPWGKKAFQAYLGTDQKAWADYDATALVTQNKSAAHILIDQAEPTLFRRTIKAAPV